MKIQWERSPFYKIRTEPIDTIVIHHTGSISMEGTLSWFCEERFHRNESGILVNIVSSHYLIPRSQHKGNDIYQLVNEDCIAYHAGRSVLNGRKGVNNFSIGIELAGDGNSYHYTQHQYNALDYLFNDITKRHKIKNIVGHEHISPDRKIDPGMYFDWYTALKSFWRSSYASHM